MLLFVLGLTWSVAGVDCLIPPSNMFYQHVHISSACNYGNLTVAFTGSVYKPKDCNSHMNVDTWFRPPFIYINSTNATERFTVVMLDMGPSGSGPGYLSWMATNVSINTPDLERIPINNVVASYQQPVLMHGAPQPTLIQILVFRHQNVLRVPFGELWITKRRSFSLSTLFSNTVPNLRLCGPVAGIQFWVHDSSLTPSAPLPPPQVPAPIQPVYMVPVVPVQPVQPVYPGQTPPHGSVVPQSPHRKSLGTVTQPMHILFVPLVICTVMFL